MMANIGSQFETEEEYENYEEIPNYNEIDQEISKLIQEFKEEERQQKEPGKPSIASCVSPLMSLLSKVRDKEMSSASTDLRLGCPDIEKCIDRDDSSSEAMKREGKI